MIANFKSKINGIRFFLQNLYCARKVNVFSSTTINSVSFRGYQRGDARQISKIYAALNNGATFSGLRKWLYDLFGSRLMLVAVSSGDSGDVLVGMNMYYFNPRDIREKTIHEGFIGVVPEMNGRGIATTMRLHAKQHFARAGFDGISTRISLQNTSSLASAEKVGFVPLEKYVDQGNGELRCYMVSKLG